MLTLLLILLLVFGGFSLFRISQFRKLNPVRKEIDLLSRELDFSVEIPKLPFFSFAKDYPRTWGKIDGYPLEIQLDKQRIDGDLKPITTLSLTVPNPFFREVQVREKKLVHKVARLWDRKLTLSGDPLADHHFSFKTNDREFLRHLLSPQVIEQMTELIGKGKKGSLKFEGRTWQFQAQWHPDSRGKTRLLREAAFLLGRLGELSEEYLPQDGGQSGQF